MKFKFASLVLLCFAVSSASAAIIYLPVEFEYGGAEKYYYGGNDPAIFARADRMSAILAAERSGSSSALPTRTYSDLFPYQPNAMLFNFNASDARNHAYNAVPRYFRMSDLARPGRVEIVNAAIIPPTAPGTIEIKPYVSARPHPATQPTTRPVVILIK